ncbi:hypothetical protein [Bacillus phage SPO1L1]|nr:hypothetical protein [Bacillus phage SPO1L1]WIT26024.1 hypothetical protein [Bacillus phage SPO1L2]
MDDNIFRSVSEEYITKYLDTNMVDSLFTVCYNISSIIGDCNGRLPRDIARRAIRNLEIVAPGVVMVGDMGEINAPQNPDIPIPQDMYVAEVTNHGYQLYTKIKKDDYTVVLGADETTRVEYFSPIVYYSEDVPPEIRYALIALYLDTFALYRELMASTYNSTLDSILYGDLERMITNLSWASRRVEKLNPVPYELVVSIRSLMDTLVHVKNVKRLFSVTYGAKLEEVLGED